MAAVFRSTPAPFGSLLLASCPLVLRQSPLREEVFPVPFLVAVHDPKWQQERPAKEEKTRRNRAPATSFSLPLQRQRARQHIPGQLKHPVPTSQQEKSARTSFAVFQCFGLIQFVL